MSSLQDKTNSSGEKKRITPSPKETVRYLSKLSESDVKQFIPLLPESLREYIFQQPEFAKYALQ